MLCLLLASEWRKGGVVVVDTSCFADKHTRRHRRRDAENRYNTRKRRIHNIHTQIRVCARMCSSRPSFGRFAFLRACSNVVLCVCFMLLYNIANTRSSGANVRTRQQAYKQSYAVLYVCVVYIRWGWENRCVCVRFVKDVMGKRKEYTHKAHAFFMYPNDRLNSRLFCMCFCVRVSYFQDAFVHEQVYEKKSFNSVVSRRRFFPLDAADEAIWNMLYTWFSTRDLCFLRVCASLCVHSAWVFVSVCVNVCV